MTPNLAYYTNPGTYDQLTWGAGKSLNPNRHAGALNRSENQSTRLAAPEKRSLRQFCAAEAAETARASYEGLTRVVAA